MIEWHYCHPLLLVFAMQHNRHVVCASVQRRLLYRGIQIEPLCAFHFEMHAVQISNNVLTFQPRELLPTSSSNSQSFGYGIRGFEFAAFAFIA